MALIGVLAKNHGRMLGGITGGISAATSGRISG